MLFCTLDIDMLGAYDEEIEETLAGISMQDLARKAMIALPTLTYMKFKIKVPWQEKPRKSYWKVVGEGENKLLQEVRSRPRAEIYRINRMFLPP